MLAVMPRRLESKTEIDGGMHDQHNTQRSIKLSWPLSTAASLFYVVYVTTIMAQTMFTCGV